MANKKLLILFFTGLFLLVSAAVSFTQQQPQTQQDIIAFLDSNIKDVWTIYVTPDGRLKISDDVANILGFQENSTIYAVLYGKRLFLFRTQDARADFVSKLNNLGITLASDNLKSALIGRGYFIDANAFYNNPSAKDNDAVLIAFTGDIYELVGLGNFRETTTPAVQKAIVSKFRNVVARFSVNDYKLNAREKDEIRHLARQLKAVGFDKILVRGHTDNTGTRRKNLTLSMNRALVVYKELIRNGIPKDKIQMTGHGARNPIATNRTKAGRALNRRTEIFVY